MDATLPGPGDRLGTVGTAVGVFLVLTALGTLVGAPWATALSGAAAAIQLFGVVLGAAVGVGLVWVSLQ